MLAVAMLVLWTGILGAASVGDGGANGRGSADALAGATIRVAGRPEIVFDWTTDRCADDDIPDLPARAFRDARRRVQLIASHTEARRHIGPHLNRLRHECAPVFVSERDADPRSFNDAEWIASLYTEDGKTVHAIIHNEYHGWEHPGRCSAAPENFFACWYNALTLAISTDSGRSYHHPVTPPRHLIATLPYRYEDGAGPYGVFTPSNIIRGRDRAYYAFVKVDDYRSPAQWVCLMRTRNLSDPRSWRFWDGSGFNGRFVNPYTDTFDNRDEHVCEPVDRDSIGDTMVESVTYNTHLNAYVLVGISADTLDGREVLGFYYSFSTDLLNWTRRKLLLEVPLPFTVADPGDEWFLYPSLIDPRSRSRNFETTGRTAYLYYTRNNAGLEPDGMDLDRDLIRVPVKFQKAPTRRPRR